MVVAAAGSQQSTKSSQCSGHTHDHNHHHRSLCSSQSINNSSASGKDDNDGSYIASGGNCSCLQSRCSNRHAQLSSAGCGRGGCVGSDCDRDTMDDENKPVAILVRGLSSANNHRVDRSSQYIEAISQKSPTPSNNKRSSSSSAELASISSRSSRSSSCKCDRRSAGSRPQSATGCGVKCCCCSCKDYQICSTDHQRCSDSGSSASNLARRFENKTAPSALSGRSSTHSKHSNCDSNPIKIVFVNGSGNGANHHTCSSGNDSRSCKKAQDYHDRICEQKLTESARTNEQLRGVKSPTSLPLSVGKHAQQVKTTSESNQLMTNKKMASSSTTGSVGSNCLVKLAQGLQISGGSGNWRAGCQHQKYDQGGEKVQQQQQQQFRSTVGNFRQPCDHGHLCRSHNSSNNNFRLEKGDQSTNVSHLDAGRCSSYAGSPACQDKPPRATGSCTPSSCSSVRQLHSSVGRKSTCDHDLRGPDQDELESSPPSPQIEPVLRRHAGNGKEKLINLFSNSPASHQCKQTQLIRSGSRCSNVSTNSLGSVCSSASSSSSASSTASASQACSRLSRSTIAEDQLAELETFKVMDMFTKLSSDNPTSNINNNNNNNNSTDFPNAYSNTDTLGNRKTVIGEPEFVGAPLTPLPPPPPPPPPPPAMPALSHPATGTQMDKYEPIDLKQMVVNKSGHLNTTDSSDWVEANSRLKRAGLLPHGIAALPAFIPPQFSAPPEDGANIKPSEYLKRVASNSALTTCGISSSSGIGSGDDSSTAGNSNNAGNDSDDENESAASGFPVSRNQQINSPGSQNSTPIGSLSSSTGASLISRSSQGSSVSSASRRFERSPNHQLSSASRYKQQLLANHGRGTDHVRQPGELVRSQSTSALSSVDISHESDREIDHLGGDHCKEDDSDNSSTIKASSSSEVGSRQTKDDLSANLMSAIRNFDRNKILKNRSKMSESTSDIRAKGNPLFPTPGMDNSMAATKRDLIAELKESRDLDGIKRMRENSRNRNELHQVIKAAASTSVFKAENFLDKVAQSEPKAPLWRQQMLAKRAAERARKEHEEKLRQELEERRLSQVPAWKRQMLAAKKAAAERNNKSTGASKVKVVVEETKLLSDNMTAWKCRQPLPLDAPD